MCFILEEPGFHYSGVLPLVFAKGGEMGGMAEGGVQEEGSSHFAPWFSVSDTNQSSSVLLNKHKQANETPFDSSLAQLIWPD